MKKPSNGIGSSCRERLAEFVNAVLLVLLVIAGLLYALASMRSGGILPLRLAPFSPHPTIENSAPANFGGGIHFQPAKTDNRQGGVSDAS